MVSAVRSISGPSCRSIPKGRSSRRPSTAIYGNVSNKGTAEYSGLYSNVWNVGGGRFGLLVDLAYSHIDTKTNEVDMTRIGAFCNGGDLDSNGKAIVTNQRRQCRLYEQPVRRQ